jgi:hypothetical protein
MAKAVSISLRKFTASVQAAVKAAAAKHPKFRSVPGELSFGYLIRGFPVPDDIAAQVTLGELQAFASEVAAQIGQAHPEALRAGAAPEGAIMSAGRHIICGLPPSVETLHLVE